MAERCPAGDSPPATNVPSLSLLTISALLARRLPKENQSFTFAEKQDNTSSNSTEKQGNKSTSCLDRSFNGTFDLVITWHTDRNQSRPAGFVTTNATNATGIQLLATSQVSHSRFENQREITYMLRGAEQFGLLKHVRRTFVVVGDVELRTFGPPRDLNWTHPQLRLISDAQLGVLGNSSYVSKFASLHKIPDIGEWILLLQDDVFPSQAFSTDSLHDPVSGLPLVRLGVDTFTHGWCGDPPGRPSMEHGPWFVNRCRLGELEQRYPKRFDEVRRLGHTNRLDVQCLYDNAAASEGWAKTSTNDDFVALCHTNGMCPPRAWNSTKFVNFQGPDVSDDYPTSSLAVARKVRNWFHRNFQTPSRFENKL